MRSSYKSSFLNTACVSASCERRSSVAFRCAAMLKAERWQLQQGCKCCARMNQANQQLHQEICELHMPKPYSLRLRLPACLVTNLAQNLPMAPSPCHGRRPCSEDAGEPSVPKAPADDFSTMRKGWLGRFDVDQHVEELWSHEITTPPPSAGDSHSEVH